MMLPHHLPSRYALVAGGLILALASCVRPNRTALYWEHRVPAKEIGALVLLPALDSRIDRRVDINLDQQVLAVSITVLDERGYAASLGVMPADVGEVSIDELPTADASWIKRLAPAGRWVMLLGLVDVTKTMTFGSTGNAEVAGFLFDTQQGLLVWRDRGVGQVGQGGLLGIMLTEKMDDWAIEDALNNLFASLPVRAAPTPSAPAA